MHLVYSEFAFGIRHQTLAGWPGTPRGPTELTGFAG